MSTKEQYDVFKFIFDQETARENTLLDRSKLYISLLTLYSGFVVFVAKDARPTRISEWLIFAAAATLLAAAFLLSLLATYVTNYEGINDPEKVIESELSQSPTDKDFFLHRIVDMAVACNRNSKVNDERAEKLHWAGILMFSGIALHTVYFLLLVWPSGVVR